MSKFRPFSYLSVCVRMLWMSHVPCIIFSPMISVWNLVWYVCICLLQNAACCFADGRYQQQHQSIDKRVLSHLMMVVISCPTLLEEFWVMMCGMVVSITVRKVNRHSYHSQWLSSDNYLSKHSLLGLRVYFLAVHSVVSFIVSVCTAYIIWVSKDALRRFEVFRRHFARMRRTILLSTLNIL